MALDKPSFGSVISELSASLTPMPNTRAAGGITNRDKQIMTWKLPTGTMVQMYINPNTLRISETKQIQTTRTKGGYIVQYWGDNLAAMTLSGTTGSSGVKGINVLREVYHAENYAFDSVAIEQNNLLVQSIGSDGESLSSGIDGMARILRDRNFLVRPTLGSFATGMTLYYQGASYLGFFTSMSVTESADRAGLFDYEINFTITQAYGKRENFMAWHREPLANSPEDQILNAAYNLIPGLDAVGPASLHPESAPLSFGGNSLAAQMGVENEAITTDFPTYINKGK